LLQKVPLRTHTNKHKNGDLPQMPANAVPALQNREGGQVMGMGKKEHNNDLSGVGPIRSLTTLLQWRYEVAVPKMSVWSVIAVIWVDISVQSAV
jgi:hypothetical protein